VDEEAAWTWSRRDARTGALVTAGGPGQRETAELSWQQVVVEPLRADLSPVEPPEGSVESCAVAAEE
jgi:hypothetical protein